MKITYLLGAGASFNALPLIKRHSIEKPGLSEDLMKFVNSNKYLINHNNAHGVFESLIKIVKQCIQFGTPDLYSKLLLETGDDSTYEILKRLLSLYFQHKQTVDECFDERALAFLTTIVTGKKLPETIRILTWNYDSQIEIAAEKLKPIKPSGYPRIQNFTSWPNVEGDEGGYQPFLFHLNGVAGFNYSKSILAEKIDKPFDFGKTFPNEVLMSFAWENENSGSMQMFHEKRLSLARGIAQGTEILVIIGYSFPFFNREIDKEIFKAMKGSLAKIYFQDPANDGSNLKSQFEIAQRLEIVHIKQTDQYHIPYEL